MDYVVNNRINLEKLIVRCKECEDCFIYSDLDDSPNMLKLSEIRCSECTICPDHGKCGKTVWEGQIGSLLVDFLSLNFDNIIDQIKLAKFDFQRIDSKEHSTWFEDYVCFLRNLLQKHHVLLEYGWPDSAFNFSPKNLDTNDLRNGLSNKIQISDKFNAFKCIQAIINEWAKDSRFYTLLSSPNSPLPIFGLALNPISRTAKISELKVKNIIHMNNIDPDNIVQTLFRVMDITESEFEEEIFYFDSTFSLVQGLFGMLIENQITVKKCEHCNKYFIPENKSDTKYCNRKSPKYPHLTCKEAAKYIKQLEREKGNSTEKLRKSIYNTLRNRLDSKKALEDENFYNKYSDDLKGFTANAAQWKADIELGKKTEKQYISWLNSFKKRGSKNGKH